MRRSTQRTLVLLASMISLALPAHAQTRGFFAGGGVIADYDRTNSRLTDHAAISWTLVAGLDVTPHVGLRILLDLPRQARETAEGVYRRSPGGPPVREKLTRTRRSMTYALLADLHGQIAPRVRLGITCGLTEVTHDVETVVVRHELRADGSTSRLADLRQVGDFDWNGIPLGMEAALLLTRRLEIVPEIRTIYFLGSDSPKPYIIRPGVGLRWRF
jgi:hypothetical protein